MIKLVLRITDDIMAGVTKRYNIAMMKKTIKKKKNQERDQGKDQINFSVS